MLLSLNESLNVRLVRSLVQSGAIQFLQEGPVTCNFRPKDAVFRSGPLTSEHMRRIGEVLSNAGKELCQDCQTVVSVPYADYPRQWADEGSPLVIAFAKLWRGMTPLGFHQARKKASAKEEVGRVLVVDTFLCDSNTDPMDEAIETLCGMSIQVVGAITFVSHGEEAVSGRPLSSVFTPRTLLEFCHKHELVPLHRRESVDRYLRSRH